MMPSGIPESHVTISLKSDASKEKEEEDEEDEARALIEEI